MRHYGALSTLKELQKLHYNQLLKYLAVEGIFVVDEISKIVATKSEMNRRTHDRFASPVVKARLYLTDILLARAIALDAAAGARACNGLVVAMYNELTSDVIAAAVCRMGVEDPIALQAMLQSIPHIDIEECIGILSDEGGLATHLLLRTDHAALLRLVSLR